MLARYKNNKFPGRILENFRIKDIIIKVPEDNIGEYLHDHGTGKDFLSKTKRY